MANLINAKRNLENIIEYLNEEMVRQEDVKTSFAIVKLIAELMKQEQYLDAIIFNNKCDIIVLRGKDE